MYKSKRYTKQMRKVTLIATTIMGFESILAKEIKSLLNLEKVTVQDTKVEFNAPLSAICDCNIWLRTAGRIYLKTAEFEAITFDELFENTKQIPWENWIRSDDQFPITQISSKKSILFSKSDSQSIIKKAIAERLKTKYKTTKLPETNTKIAIRAQIDKNIVTLSIDTSGEGLHKRGYRTQMDKAPLRETLAAGLILLSNFNAEKDVLIDPFCGSGTLLIEAGLIAKNIAPGLNRTFVSEQFHFLSQKNWQASRQKAKSTIKQDADFKIFGSDKSYRALSIAEENIKRAGLSNIFVQKRDITEIGSRFTKGKIICNPPYGERLDSQEEIEQLIQTMGKTFTKKFPDWSYYIISSHPKFEDHFGIKATKNRKLYNGGIKCWYYQYYANTRKKTNKIL